jgi:preprotein translocase subunit YajC
MQIAGLILAVVLVAGMFYYMFKLDQRHQH